MQIMYLPEGCSKDQIILTDIEDKIKDTYVFHDICKFPFTVAQIFFGPKYKYAEYKYAAILDDNGLLKDNPISTVEINGHMLHGPVFIVKNKGENWVGLTPEDVIFVKNRLNLLHGAKVFDEIPAPKVMVFDSDEDLFAAVQKNEQHKDEINKNKWIDQANVINLPKKLK